MPLFGLVVAWGFGVGAALRGAGVAVAAGLAAVVGCACVVAAGAAVAAPGVASAAGDGEGLASAGFCASSARCSASSMLAEAGLPADPTSVMVRAGWYVLFRMRSRDLLPSDGITWRTTDESKPSRAVSTTRERPHASVGSSCASGLVSGGTRLVMTASSTCTFHGGFLPYRPKYTFDASVADWIRM